MFINISFIDIKAIIFIGRRTLLLGGCYLTKVGTLIVIFLILFCTILIMNLLLGFISVIEQLIIANCSLIFLYFGLPLHCLNVRLGRPFIKLNVPPRILGYLLMLPTNIWRFDLVCLDERTFNFVAGGTILFNIQDFSLVVTQGSISEHSKLSCCCFIPVLFSVSVASHSSSAILLLNIYLALISSS